MKQTVLITGASRGIGRAAARLFAQAGYQVAINYNKSQTQALALEQELLAEGHAALAVKADVSYPDEVANAVDKVLQSYQQIDILICNAGIAGTELFQDLSLAQWHSYFSVNLDGMFHCIQAILPQMLHRKAGKIITVSSMWGITGASCEAAYSTSKAAVIGLTKSLAKELGPSHIQVNCIAPGAIDTDMLRALGAEALEMIREETPLGVLGQPHDIASAMLYLASPAADFITGQVISPNGGILI